MDLVDKSILLELSANCRISYQSLANKLDLTVNAIKKRIAKLTETGVIQRYCVYLSLAMLDAEILLAIIKTDGTRTEDDFLDELGANPMVYGASYLVNWDVLLFAEYVGSDGLAKLGKFLRQHENVKEVEMHTLQSEKGSKGEFSRSDLKVLRCLAEDARMSVAEIARQTGLTPKRVRKIIQKMLGEGGSTPEWAIEKTSIGDYRTSQACIHFRLWWDLNAAGGTAFLIRIGWDEGKGSLGEIVDWLKKEFPIEFWYAYALASEPTMFTVYVVEHLREADQICKRIQQGPHVNTIEAIFGYPGLKYKSLRETRLEELLNQIEPKP
ncbi:MAG: winged helix-turn-helix transcriptional regulator [Candidatus Hermodarchaeota archaeon]